MVILSKSKYLIGLQCPKHLWILFHEPEKIPEVDKATQYRFDQGNLVGELAKSIYPNGINIPTGDLNENIEQTKEFLKKRIVNGIDHIFVFNNFIIEIFLN